MISKWRKRYLRLVAAGLCGLCGKRPPESGRKHCRACLDYKRTTRPGRKRRRAQWAAWYARNRERRRAARKRLMPVEAERRWQLRIETFRHYGPCTCCGQTAIDFLSIDHVNNDGASHRRRLTGYPTRGGGMPLYRRLARLGWPTEIDGCVIRVHCYNCNMARQFSRERVCPHQRADVLTV